MRRPVETTKLAASAITSTDAIASDATTHVEPHSSANCVIDFVSSSMKPAPSRKNGQDVRRVRPRSTGATSATDASRINPIVMR